MKLPFDRIRIQRNTFSATLSLMLEGRSLVDHEFVLPIDGEAIEFTGIVGTVAVEVLDYKGVAI